MPSSAPIEHLQLHVVTDTQDGEPSEGSVEARLVQSSLPPVDKGLGAWSFLAAAFLIEVIVWSFPSSFGIFLDAYRQNPVYQQQKNSNLLLPLIGPLGSGILYCSGPLVNALTGKYPNYRRYFMWVGAILTPASLFAASFTTRLPLLLFLQGVMNAFGGILLYYPCISYMSEWFVERRGFAIGVIFAGTALGGFVLPLILPHLISTYGSQKTLRYLSIASVSLLLPAMPFAKGRLPGLRSHISGPEPRGITRGWLKSKVFWILICVNTLEGFGHFVPIIWLPTYATALRINSTQASVTLALLNGAAFVSGLVLGYLSDMMNPWLLSSFNMVLTSLTTFVLWGVFSTNFGGLLAFGIVYGSLAGGFSSLWSAFTRPMANDDPRVVTIMIGYLGLSRGIGSILSTPISSALSMGSNNATFPVGHETIGFKVEDGKYEKMILYVGTCFAGAALISLVGWIGDRRARLSQDVAGSDSY
ncbi:MFS general substrate transporter [Marasmius fiardii PR-910]|nr:MFS general substrate transporter [Marasmius fiardii PR-910]